MIRLAFAILFVSLEPLAARTATNSPALDLARQLNNAFIEVAEKVSPSVVVIKIAHKPGTIDLDDSENPLWDLIPREFRKQMEEERDKRRKKVEEDEESK